MILVGVLQDVEAFGIGLHDAVFHAVMDHLGEMARTGRTGMDVALLDPGIAARTARRLVDRADARRQGLEDRIEVVDGLLGAADHHAVPALQTPDATAGADIDKGDALLRQHLGMRDVVEELRIAAVDQDVALAQEAVELDDRVMGDLAGRQHDPEAFRRFELRHEIGQPGAARGALAGELLYHLRVAVIDHALMAVAQQTAHDVAAHAAESDHSELHCLSPLSALFD